MYVVNVAVVYDVVNVDVCMTDDDNVAVVIAIMVVIVVVS